MSDHPGGDLEQLERRGWDALCGGSGAAFYDELMTADCVMVLAHGQAMTRDEVVDAMRHSPPWDRYELSDLRLVATGAASAALVYRATAEREGQPPFAAWMTSVYVRGDDGWRLALYTQTPVPTAG